MVFVAEERDVVALFGEIPLIANIGRNASRADGHASQPAPSHLFPTRRVTIEVGQLGPAAEEIVPHRAAVKTHRASREAHQQRQVQILIPLVSDDLADAGLADFVVRPVRVENHLWLEKHLVANASVQAELRAELDFVHAKIKSRVAPTDDDVLRFVDLGVHATFDADGKLRVRRVGEQD